MIGYLTTYSDNLGKNDRFTSETIITKISEY